ncbi:MCE family protein [Mycolicibacterium diernhoferi]|uniref:Mammalian cell entry protein n=1 Tax=Mycolicibacterium diernhoferi TaxID=1801 RepID=A0A1Q4H428_9MYCO|nr:MCE family protein [Mycolicibacterium diernhoferi]OJZ61218.1 mammalian cell entry protein [Mycolicibacterium diernhoferi]OPE54036.1 mammalian cell entry protein [Mycolicibacterium diernhoferi]PEG55712.1 mammalian cell entry protein [Mycolicibacterium diernhoferi]QYL20589.1 MCE family protein [Mycolicibacterium diernhoferi]
MIALGPRVKKIAAVAAAALAVTGAGFAGYQYFLSPKTITAYFESATAIYPGDEVRVVGVRVGTIKAIEPLGTRTRVTLEVDRDVPVPADAKAIIVAPNLVAARYVQLTPAYGATPEASGATMADGAEIGADRTAIPVEWDEIKEQLTRLATELGPESGVSGTSLGRFIDSTADAMAGNGDRLRETITQLSDVGRVLGEGSGDIVDVIKNLQVFVTALRDSNTQIVQFQDRLADVTSVVNGSRADLDSAINELSSAVVKVQKFVAGSRDQTAEQIQRLANVTQVLSDNSMTVKNVLHAAPNALVNGYNIYNPDTGGPRGSFAMNNFANPVATICSAISAVENVTAEESGRACAQYLGPALRLMNFNHLPFPFNAYLGPAPKNVIYTDPALAPGGGGTTPAPAEIPPSVSAYTGAGDVPPPPGWTDPAQPPGAYAPTGLPAARTPALFPGAPIPPGLPVAPPAAPTTATNLTDLLLPAEAAPGPAQGGTP